MFIQVAIPLPLRQAFTYEAGEGAPVKIGSRVMVPLGKRTVAGVVIDKSAGPQVGRLTGQIKEIKEVIEEPPVFSPKMVELVKWMASYYCAPIGEVCKAALPAELARRAGRKKRERRLKETVIEPAFLNDDFHELTVAQIGAYDSIRPFIAEPKFLATLLHGITGSGKTEVYLRLFADVVAKGGQAIFLVPEIGMTPQTLGRLASRFGSRVAVYHSGLTEAMRIREWRRMQKGEADIVIGTRSAVFAPFPRLSLIVVDEEHDSSYKQDENPRYNGRDTAVMRAKIEGIPCVLGSATPSMESFANFRNGKYHYIHLPERPTGAPLPNVEVVDMKGVPKGANLSPRTVASISEALARGEQAILFLNRRGFASVVICGECGAAFTCPNCNITYAYHKYEGRLKCHYCDAGIVSPKRCDKCGSVNIRQLGIGTERIEEEIKGYFPKARVARFDRDVTLKAGARPKILADMKKGKIDILIGTQMITKGHDFPNVTLVGVLDADLSLNFPDFRAPERTFQLITQAAGRSGRRDMAGEVIVQTFTPEHYAISAAREHDFVRFYESELPFRRELGYPPFGRVALFKIQGSSEAGVKQFSHALFDALSGFLRATGHRSPATILGPSPAPIAKLRNKYRWQIMVRSADIAGIQKAISQALAFPVPRGIKLSIDMDSVNMM